MTLAARFLANPPPPVIELLRPEGVLRLAAGGVARAQAVGNAALLIRAIISQKQRVGSLGIIIISILCGVERDRKYVDRWREAARIFLRDRREKRERKKYKIQRIVRKGRV